MMKNAGSLLIIILALLGGCIQSARQTGIGGIQEVTYDFWATSESESGSIGSLTWQWLAESHIALDAGGGRRSVDLVRQTIDIPALVPELAPGPYKVIQLIDPATRTDVAEITGCDGPLVDCQALLVNWPLETAVTVWFGAPLLHGVDWKQKEAHLAFGGKDVVLQLKGLPNGDVRSVPTHAGGRFTWKCNVLDDETVIDPDLGIIIECHSASDPTLVPRWIGTRGHLLGNVATTGVAVAPRLAVEARPREGPLPPGADYHFTADRLTLAEAHREAAERSSRLRNFLAANPETAAFEKASLSSSLSSSTGPGELYSQVYHLIYVGPRGEGVEIQLEREDIVVGGVRLSSTYRVTQDDPWTAPPEHNWSSPRPLPERMAGVDDVVRSLAQAGPGWNPASITLQNVAAEGDPGPTYNYFVKLPTLCRTRACISDYVQVDPAERTLVQASLTGDNVAGFVAGT